MQKKLSVMPKVLLSRESTLYISPWSTCHLKQSLCIKETLNNGKKVLKFTTDFVIEGFTWERYHENQLKPDWNWSPLNMGGLYIM